MSEAAEPAPTPAHAPAVTSHFQKHAYLYIALITLFAGSLRFPGLEQHPPGLFRDEAEKGYNAYALATRGGVLEMNLNQWQAPGLLTFKPWPWMININGTRTSAIYQYIDAPFVKLGGLTVANTRRAAALMGTLAVLLAGLAGVRIWGAAPGLLIALWVAVSPWHIIFSRWAQQGSCVPFLLMLALAGCCGLEQRRRWAWPLTGAGLGWLFYAYSGAQPFVLAWGVCLLALYYKSIRLKSAALWVGLILFLIPVVPTVVVTLQPGGATRMANVAVWSPGQSPFSVAGQIVRNYLIHFGPSYLFFAGDPELRHAMPRAGTMLWVDAVLLPLGLFAAFRNKLPLRGALLAALLCGPVGGALTKEVPHALRGFPQALPSVAFSALGLHWILSAMRGKLAQQPKTGVPRWLYPALILLLCAGMGLNVFARYWRAGATDPGYALAFQSSMGEAWRKLAVERKPAERLYFSLRFFYAPYYQLFYERPDPVEIALHGQAASNIVYTPLEYSQIEQQARPGDWILYPFAPKAADRTADVHEMLSCLAQVTTHTLVSTR